MTPAQIQVQQQTAMQQQELAKRRGRKPMDRTLPEGLEEVIGADVTQQYRALKELERRTDASFLRKRADVQDSVNRTIKVRSSLIRPILSSCNILKNPNKKLEVQNTSIVDFQHGGESALARSTV